MSQNAFAQEGLVVERLPGRVFIADAPKQKKISPEGKMQTSVFRLPNARPASSYALRQVLRLEVYGAPRPKVRKRIHRRSFSPSERAALRRDLLRIYENESFVVHVSPQPKGEFNPHQK